MPRTGSSTAGSASRVVPRGSTTEDSSPCLPGRPRSACSQATSRSNSRTTRSVCDPVPASRSPIRPPLLMAGTRPRAAVETASGWLERFGLGGRLDHRLNELSAGQQQRVAVARGIANGQQVVLADEPTAELDERSAGVVLEALHDVAV